MRPSRYPANRNIEELEGVVDGGRAEVTGRADDIRKFRTPTLRNAFVTEPYFHDNDLLVVDAAGWDRDLPTHRGALNHLHEYVKWGNDQIVFTHVGRSAPPHTEAMSTLRSMSPRAQLAYDYMKLPLGR